MIHASGCFFLSNTTGNICLQLRSTTSNHPKTWSFWGGKSEEGEKPMYFLQAAGISIANGLTIINDWLNYDQNEPISVLNEPNLYVSSDCGNLIYSLQEWTSRDGEKGATKDPVDSLRYLAVMEPIYVTDKTFAASQVQGY